MTLAAAHTLGIEVSIPAAIILSVLSALAACGASGVAGGSLLLIPMACSLFGIGQDVAMQVVAVGFIIGVVHGSVIIGCSPWLLIQVQWTGSGSGPEPSRDLPAGEETQHEGLHSVVSR